MKSGDGGGGGLQLYSEICICIYSEYLECKKCNQVLDTRGLKIMHGTISLIVLSLIVKNVLLLQSKSRLRPRQLL